MFGPRCPCPGYADEANIFKYIDYRVIHSETYG
jgi:hypothetical protein